jgi:hypothetical protein|nr:MAG TPA: hypothetical protein [Caudoviricetes sp.]
MATRFSVWIDNPVTGTNIQSYSNFANDAQRKSGFSAGTPASSIRVNTALRETTLFTTGFMKAFFDTSTLDPSSTVAQMATALSNLIATKTYVDTSLTEKILAEVEAVFNDKITISDVEITEGAPLMAGTIYIYY